MWKKSICTEIDACIPFAQLFEKNPREIKLYFLVDLKVLVFFQWQNGCTILNGFKF